MTDLADMPCSLTSRSEYNCMDDGPVTDRCNYQGVKFEPNSFKLTHEMVVLMGGRNSQGYQMFQQLTVKAFLAIRPHADQIVSTVQMMLETQLPSFKGEPTIKRLRDRFALGLTERQAAEWMMAIVRNAHENVRSTAYDEFQRVSYSLLLSVRSLLMSPLQLQNGTLCCLATYGVYSHLPRDSVQVGCPEVVFRKGYDALGIRTHFLNIFIPPYVWLPRGLNSVVCVSRTTRLWLFHVIASRCLPQSVCRVRPTRATAKLYRSP